MTSESRALGLLAVAWVLVVIGAVVLVFGYGSMPGAVVLYRPPWADAPTIGGPLTWLLASLALWAVFAIAPRWLACASVAPPHLSRPPLDGYIVGGNGG